MKHLPGLVIVAGLGLVLVTAWAVLVPVAGLAYLAWSEYLAVRVSPELVDFKERVTGYMDMKPLERLSELEDKVKHLQNRPRP